MILADTGPLVALCDPHDEKHRAAVRLFKTLGKERFATCEAVLVETHFHLRTSSARERLWDILRELEMDLLGSAADSQFIEALVAWLRKYADHQPDWTDAVLAVLSGSDPSLKVWTYDREFRTTWRKPNGRPIPIIG